MTTCDACAKAEQLPDYPRHRRGCVGCAIRELANGPLFHASGIDGSLATAYRKQLGLIFGDDIRGGHAQVKAAYERIRNARAML